MSSIWIKGKADPTHTFIYQMLVINIIHNVHNRNRYAGGNVNLVFAMTVAMNVLSIVLY